VLYRSELEVIPFERGMNAGTIKEILKKTKGKVKN
jgi:hypothetical protein